MKQKIQKIFVKVLLTSENKSSEPQGMIKNILSLNLWGQ